MISPNVVFRISEKDIKDVDRLVNRGEFVNRTDFFKQATKKMLETYQDRLSEKVFFTIGYEGRDSGDFVSLLRKNGVRRLVDVREIPASRKKDFNKTRLNQILTEEGISYVHIRELGSPKEIREKYKSNRDFDWFSIKYRNYLDGLNGPVTRLEGLVGQEGTCLMCVEKDYSVCHRSLIAEKLREEGYVPVHIP